MKTLFKSFKPAVRKNGHENKESTKESKIYKEKKTEWGKTKLPINSYRTSVQLTKRKASEAREAPVRNST